VPQSDEVELQKLRDKLQAVEMAYLKGMRARGFDPVQAENLALPSPLAELYAEREDLLERLALLEGRNSIDE
jgi:hypothetical protein